MTAVLRLGPLLRYVDWDTGTSATVWVEADRPCEAEVRCADGAGGTARTWRIAGHHYALVPVTGLRPGSTTAYGVFLDGERVWPPPGSLFPESVIRTPGPATDTVRVTFGSCRWAAPPPEAGGGPGDAAGPDALDALAATLVRGHGENAQPPDVLLLLGDQVYADKTSEATRRRLAARRCPAEPPGHQVADYEEYTYLYEESWLDPDVRWLLSTVPSLMIFDDHDLIDDWNTSAAWLAGARATPWWQERVLGGLMSYWVHQHLGNLSPAELAADKLYQAVCESGDGTQPLREFAVRADADPAAARWSYRRDFGRVRLLMADTRTRRVLEEGRRAMLDAAARDWLRDQALDAPGSYDHLLIGTSLPWLMPSAAHDAEAWNQALCAGERGPRWARLAEILRRRADMEHWAAFPASFEALTALVAEVGGGPEAPATVAVLSGDVHHAYVAEPAWPATRPVRSTVLQLTCSPVRQKVPGALRLAFRFGWSGAGRRLGRALARHGRVGRPSIGWRRTGGPWFGNQLMTLTLRGRSARLRLDQARTEKDLVTAHEATYEATYEAVPGATNGAAYGPGGAAGPPPPRTPVERPAPLTDIPD
ncbi:alkaline phosphatase D family protein [Streptomyces sp. ISL-11]|uniref:alkaline phosphatase D family protein n=1 Tax=Streptomyces sp. ISL-11 TaxID=2819174 RepID=UPI001BEB3AA8|nr:alkaline phosphatase D family protein [Streptomyces sp. ISL-11]MBT2383666.1 alkaline phosphatase family protein [Streptomyces sp. ISL-11]